MDKVYVSTHRDVLNFDMKNTFLVCQHIIWRQVHTTNDNTRLIVSGFLEKIVRRFSEIEGQITYNRTMFNIQSEINILDTSKFRRVKIVLIYIQRMFRLWRNQVINLH